MKEKIIDQINQALATGNEVLENKVYQRLGEAILLGRYTFEDFNFECTKVKNKINASDFAIEYTAWKNLQISTFSELENLKRFLNSFEDMTAICHQFTILRQSAQPLVQHEIIENMRLLEFDNPRIMRYFIDKALENEDVVEQLSLFSQLDIPRKFADTFQKASPEYKVSLFYRASREDNVAAQTLIDILCRTHLLEDIDLLDIILEKIIEDNGRITPLRKNENLLQSLSRIDEKSFQKATSVTVNKLDSIAWSYDVKKILPGSINWQAKQLFTDIVAKAVCNIDCLVEFFSTPRELICKTYKNNLGRCFTDLGTLLKVQPGLQTNWNDYLFNLFSEELSEFADDIEHHDVEIKLCLELLSFIFPYQEFMECFPKLGHHYSNEVGFVLQKYLSMETAYYCPKLVKAIILNQVGLHRYKFMLDKKMLFKTFLTYPECFMLPLFHELMTILINDMTHTKELKENDYLYLAKTTQIFIFDKLIPLAQEKIKAFLPPTFLMDEEFLDFI